MDWPAWYTMVHHGSPKWRSKEHPTTRRTPNYTSSTQLQEFHPTTGVPQDENTKLKPKCDQNRSGRRPDLKITRQTPNYKSSIQLQEFQSYCRSSILLEDTTGVPSYYRSSNTTTGVPSNYTSSIVLQGFQSHYRSSIQLQEFHPTTGVPSYYRSSNPTTGVPSNL